MNVPIHGRIWGEAEHANLAEVVQSDWYTHGKWNSRFENALAKYTGVKHVSLCNSGSSANLLAVSALELEPGDEVITTAVNFPTTVNPILQVGAVPVFVDVKLPHMTIDVKQLEEAWSPRTRAVVVAHTLGYPCEGRLPPLQYGLPLNVTPRLSRFLKSAHHSVSRTMVMLSLDRIMTTEKTFRRDWFSSTRGAYRNPSRDLIHSANMYAGFPGMAASVSI